MLGLRCGWLVVGWVWVDAGRGTWDVRRSFEGLIAFNLIPWDLSIFAEI